MRKLENQKEIIFKTAKEILTSEDISKFSIRMISTRCNIGMGTIYKYYGNKDDIIIDITRDLWMSYTKEIASTTISFHSMVDYVEFLYNQLVIYSNQFNYTILSKELSATFRKAGKPHHNKAQDIFISIICEKLTCFYNLDEEKAIIVSNFISNNLISLITNKQYRFDIFKNVLTDLLRQYKEKN